MNYKEEFQQRVDGIHARVIDLFTKIQGLPVSAEAQPEKEQAVQEVIDLRKDLEACGLFHSFNIQSRKAS